MHILNNEFLSYDDVLIRPVHSQLGSRSEADISTQIGNLHLHVPVISSNMDTITGVKMAKKMAELGGLGLVHRYMSVAEQAGIIREWDHGPLGVSVGVVERDKERIDATLEAYRKSSSLNKSNFVLCVDIAHGDSAHMVDTLKYIRDSGFDATLMAGAVATSEAAINLFEAGADVLRTGIGPGSVCSTRLKTGCGVPQFSAVVESAEVGSIIADGGIRYPGDAAKALAAGAKCVMIGSMLAGTDCVPGWHPHEAHMRFRGMASLEARENFGQPGVNAEGVSVDVPTQEAGSTERIITEICEGVRSAMSYSNSKTLTEFNQNVVFQRVTGNTVAENVPHILNKI